MFTYYENTFDKMGEIKSVLDSTPVYRRSSFIENCWLWTDVKCLCDEFVKNIKMLTIFAKKAPSKIAVVIKQLLPTHFHLLKLGGFVIVAQ